MYALRSLKKTFGENFQNLKNKIGKFYFVTEYCIDIFNSVSASMMHLWIVQIRFLRRILSVESQMV